MNLDCRNCHESLAEPVTFDEVFVAVECPVCGVRGPIRPLFSPERFDRVAKLATDDWNLLFRRLDYRIEKFVKAKNPESNETNGTGKAPSLRPDKPVLDKPAPSQAVAPPLAGEGGEGDSKPFKKMASVVVESSKAGAVAKRLKAWFKANNTNPDYAVKRDGIDFGVSTATLYHLMNGTGSQATVDKVTAALDRLECRIPANLEGVEIEVLPNHFQPITGINRLPIPTAPPRCGRTP